MDKRQRMAERKIAQLEVMRRSGLLSFPRLRARNESVTMNAPVQPQPTLVDVRSGRVVTEDNHDPDVVLLTPPDWVFID